MWAGEGVEWRRNLGHGGDCESWKRLSGGKSAF